MKKKNTIIIVGVPTKETISKMSVFKKEYLKKGSQYKFLLLHNKPVTENRLTDLSSFFDFIHEVNFDSAHAIITTLLPYQNNLCGISSLGAEAAIPLLRKVIPHVPYLKTPTTESLEWATDKILMRKRFRSYNKTIGPRYQIIQEITRDTIENLEQKIGYPMIIKPANLASSMLVSIAYHREELEKTLKKVSKKITKIYRDSDRKEQPRILVEQYLDGEEFSVDAYANNEGKIYFCPIVQIKKASSIGIDDFFHYMRITPYHLNTIDLHASHKVASEAIHALGLRNSSAHIEMIKTESGWKIVEIGARLGGYRDAMYSRAYNLEHIHNDLRNRLGLKPVISKKYNGYTAVFEIFGRKEGVIQKILGLKKIKLLESFHSLNMRKKAGDKNTFAKNGGKPVLSAQLFNNDKSRLLADIRRLESYLQIIIH
ncbi:MAG: ATP-grasp domain-containing protein [Candidatus Pacebacteria bacterium]|nr:ATP-grasp domain-containing protein [Candidatus Paceibacterota bacterium]